MFDKHNNNNEERKVKKQNHIKNENPSKSLFLSFGTSLWKEKYHPLPPSTSSTHSQHIYKFCLSFCQQTNKQTEHQKIKLKKERKKKI